MAVRKEKFIDLFGTLVGEIKTPNYKDENDGGRKKGAQ